MCCMGETSQYQNAGTHLKWYLCGFATVKRIILSKKVFTVDKNFRHIPFSKHFRHVQLSYSKIREGVELGGGENVLCWQVSKRQACDSRNTLHYISWNVPKHRCMHPQNVGKHNQKKKKDPGHNTAYQCRINNTSSSKST